MDRPLSAPPDWHDPPPESACANALKFIKACPLTADEERAEGKTLGDTWMPWEDKLTRHLFGKRVNGRRQYKTVYVEMPKKSGKSHYAAALMLYELMYGAYGGQLFSAAYELTQAKYVWDTARRMVQMSPWLAKRLKIKDYPAAHEIENPRRDNIYSPITRKAAGKHGFNPSVVALDELHTQPDRELWDTIDDSMGARSEPLLFAITNSGHDRQSICYQQREYAIANNDGEFEDPSFLGVVYGADLEVDDPWDEATWKKANPGLGTTVPVEWLANKAEQARRQPAKQNAFFRWQLGIWTQQVTRWLKPEDWVAAEEEIDWKDWEGARCYGGLDLGEVHDLTAWVLAFPDPNDPETVRLKCTAWCPEARLYDDSNVYRDQYQVWAREGWLQTVTGHVMDYATVEDAVLADAETYGLVDMAVDVYQSTRTRVELGKAGLEVAGMKTTFKEMTSPCAELERRLLMDPPKIRHDGNPVLAWAVGNVALKTPDDDRMRPVKDSREALIDPVVATLMALERCNRHEDPERKVSPYEERELVVL